MTKLRVGSRGSDLALWQTRWIVSCLKSANSSLSIEEVIIKTHGDTAVDQRFDANWPVGGFVGAIEQALDKGEIDFAVHSYKDMQTQVTAGLTIAAIPPREVVHDVLVTRGPIDLDNLAKGFRLGTSSPRRVAQFKRLSDVEIVEIRGNVGTRIAKLERDDLDGVVLAGAGLKRLGIKPDHITELPVNRFVPAPAQGALAIQTREDDPAKEIIATLDDARTRRTVEAERSFLSAINAGCHTPVGALASVDGPTVSLHGQLFSDDGSRLAEGVGAGDDPTEVGELLAERLLEQLGDRT